MPGHPPSDPTNRSYESRGASPHKPDVRKAIEHLDQGIFPGAFCKAIPDIFTGSTDHCLLTHADGAGTKSALAYLHYRRHHKPNIFQNIAQDSMVMNLDDLFCVGATGPFILSNTIGRNAKLVDGQVIAAIIDGYEGLAAHLRHYGVEVYPCGGETADLGDVVRTVVVDSVLTVRMRRQDFIDCSQVRPNQDIVGLASSGQAVYEDCYNSGIGTNGFTTARHELLHSQYKDEYPETFAPDIAALAYTGKFDIDDPLPNTTMSIGEALLSPTRTYAPVLLAVLTAHGPSISAIFHNSGGGQTKCLSFGHNIMYIKDSLFDFPPIFTFLRQHTHLSLREMFRVFNMGHRLEIVCDPAVSSEIIAIASRFDIDAKVLGRTDRNQAGNSLTIVHAGETIRYEALSACDE